MGDTILLFYKKKISKESKIAFLSALILGFIIHMYKFNNTLFIHDSLYNFYNNQNVVGSGRWFLSIACGLGSYYDLQWLNGVLSMIFIALTSVVLRKIFEVKNVIVVIIISGLLVSFPGTTETLYFGFTADGYFMAMFLAALAVYFSRFENKKKIPNIIAGICLCLSCAIYQSYVSFALVLTLLYFVKQSFENKHSNKENLQYICKQLILYVISLSVYYIIWKLCMFVQGTTANNYQGISELNNLSNYSLNLDSLITSLKTNIMVLITFFMERNIFKHGITFYAILNVTFIILLVITVIFIVKKSGLYKRKMNLILAIISFLLCIPVSCLWIYASPTVIYRPMMLHCLCVLYIFLAVISDDWFEEKISNIIGVLLIIMIFNNAVSANIQYTQMQNTYEQSYAIAIQMNEQIRKISSEEEFSEIAIIGNRIDEVAINNTNPHLLDRLLEKDVMFDTEHIQAFLENVLGVEYKYTTLSDILELETYDTIKEMPNWPDYNAMEVIGDKLVIKIGNVE